MSECRYQGMAEVAKALDRGGVSYTVESYEDMEFLSLHFSIRFGSSVRMLFMNTDDGNDITLRITGLMNDIPDDKLGRAYAICNRINNKYCYIKLFVDSDHDLALSYNIPIGCDTESVGKVAVTLLALFKDFLDDHYKDLVIGIYSDTDESTND